MKKTFAMPKELPMIGNVTKGLDRNLIGAVLDLNRSLRLRNTVPALRKDEWGDFSQIFWPLVLSKNRGLAKKRYYHEIGRKKIRRMVYSDPEKLIWRPIFCTISFFRHLSHSSFRSAKTVSIVVPWICILFTMFSCLSDLFCSRGTWGAVLDIEGPETGHEKQARSPP